MDNISSNVKQCEPGNSWTSAACWDKLGEFGDHPGLSGGGTRHPSLTISKQVTKIARRMEKMRKMTAL